MGGGCRTQTLTPTDRRRHVFFFTDRPSCVFRHEKDTHWRPALCYSPLICRLRFPLTPSQQRSWGDRATAGATCVRRSPHINGRCTGDPSTCRQTDDRCHACASIYVYNRTTTKKTWYIHNPGQEVGCADSEQRVRIEVRTRADERP